MVGLDIGTTKICAIVGEMKDGGRIDIIGIGSHASRGLRKGVVVNIESTVESIKKAVEEAELMAGVDIKAVYAGIAGGHIKGFNSRGVIAVKDKEISKSDMDRVIDAARAVAIPLDREVLHILPQEFIIDNQDGIKEPLGMSGVRLEAEVHIVTGAVTSVQNIIKSCHRADLEVLDIVLEPLASGEAVLTQEEKDLGVAVVDVGGGTTDIAIFLDGSIRHTAVLAIGGNHLTNDIAVGLRTPSMEAEKIKKKYGCALTSLVMDDETIEVPSMGGRAPRVLSRQVLSEIIQPRAEEIFELVNREIRKTSYEEMIASGIVLTGGTAIMEGIPEVAEDILELPVRRGKPINIGGLVDIVNSPLYATGVGLVLYGAKGEGAGGTLKFTDENLFGRVLSRMKEWVGELF
ncbi:MAG: cell division protein FtsA [Nitrospirae bacterium]|nr:cell division protein FtsA [Nitrospirota bacterium]